MPLRTEVASLLIRMRLMIRKEFGITLSLQDPDAVTKFCTYALKSMQPQLRDLAQQVESLEAPMAPPVVKTPEVHSRAIPPSTPVAAPPVPSRPEPPADSPDFRTPEVRPRGMPPSAPVAAPPVPSRPVPPPAPPVVRTPSAPPQEAVASTEASGTAVTTPTHFLEILASERCASPVRLVYPGGPPVVIDKPQNRCLLSSVFKDILPLGKVSVQALRLESVSPMTLLTEEKQANIVSLEAFMWFCGMQFSTRTLLPWLATWTGFRLNRWPDFGKLPSTRQHLRLATLLTQQAHTLESLVGNAAVPQDEVVAFLNTAFLCDWLREDSSVPVPVAAKPPPAPQHAKSIIGRIRARLGLS